LVFIRCKSRKNIDWAEFVIKKLVVGPISITLLMIFIRCRGEKIGWALFVFKKLVVGPIVINSSYDFY